MQKTKFYRSALAWTGRVRRLQKYPLQQKKGIALKNVVGKIKTNITARKPLTITYNVTGKQVNLKAIKMLREFAIHTRQDIKSLNGGNI